VSGSWNSLVRDFLGMRKVGMRQHATNDSGTRLEMNQVTSASTSPADLKKQGCAAEQQPTQGAHPDHQFARRQGEARDVGFNKYGA
jgi:hypothetical protein